SGSNGGNDLSQRASSPQPSLPEEEREKIGQIYREFHGWASWLFVEWCERKGAGARRQRSRANFCGYRSKAQGDSSLAAILRRLSRKPTRARRSDRYSDAGASVRPGPSPARSLGAFPLGPGKRW